MYQRVEALKTVYEKTTLEVKDHYQFRPDRKYHWLQKLCLWALRKLGCYALTTNTNIVKHVVNTDTLMQGIFAQLGELAAIYNYKGQVLLVGYEEFSQLQGFPINHPLSIYCDYMWQEYAGMKEDFSGPVYKRTAMGLRVIVIPWMKGFLIVPKEAKYNDSLEPNSRFRG